MRTAILDLGTNTFNLLITETGPAGGAEIILSRKEPVKLGHGGINRGVILPDAIERGLAAIENHMKYIHLYGAEKIHAFATSAIRSAGNGSVFVKMVKEKFNITVKVISGDREAELIYLGVKQAIDLGMEKHLIIDIGGGSNELIIADCQQIFWKESYPIGMARLLDRFRPSDPIRQDEILSIENHIARSLKSFLDAARRYNPVTLIGSSGSFDTFRALLTAGNGKGPADTGQNPAFRFTPQDFFRLHGLLVKSTAQQRFSMEGMDPVRVEMIVIAGIFVNFIVRSLNIRLLMQSDFSLKEGAVACMLKHHIRLPQQEKKLSL
jgi:exopolyphosphatase / guanosine-5'-triphosphate,3'-diphosphate pyrophosphatase